MIASSLFRDEGVSFLLLVSISPRQNLFRFIFVQGKHALHKARHLGNS